MIACRKLISLLEKISCKTIKPCIDSPDCTGVVSLLTITSELGNNETVGLYRDGIFTRSWRSNRYAGFATS